MVGWDKGRQEKVWGEMPCTLFLYSKHSENGLAIRNTAERRTL